MAQDETELARQAMQKTGEVASNVGREVVQGSRGFFGGAWNTVKAIPKGALSGALHYTLPTALFLGGAMITGIARPIARFVGQEAFIEKLEAKVKPENGGVPALLLNLFGYSAAAGGALGATQAGIGELTGSVGGDAPSIGSTLGSVVAIGTVAAIGIGAVVQAGEGKPGTPAITPGTGKQAANQRS